MDKLENKGVRKTSTDVARLVNCQRHFGHKRMAKHRVLSVSQRIKVPKETAVSLYLSLTATPPLCELYRSCKSMRGSTC